MKLRITFKDPEAVRESLREAAIEKLGFQSRKLTESERFEVADAADELYNQVRPWFKYGEYVTLEFDMESQTMSVVKGA